MRTTKVGILVLVLLCVAAASVCVTMAQDEGSAQDQPSMERLIQSLTTDITMLDDMISDLDYVVQESQQQKIALVEFRGALKARKADLEEPELRLRGFMAGAFAGVAFNYVMDQTDKAIKRVERHTERIEKGLKEQKKRRKEQERRMPPRRN